MLSDKVVETVIWNWFNGWLVNHFGLSVVDITDNDNEALRISCIKGRIRTVQWLVDCGRLTVQDIRANNNQFFLLCWWTFNIGSMVNRTFSINS